MKKLIVQFMFAMVIGVAIVSFSYAADQTESFTPKTIKGDLLKIDGDFYVVKDMAGKEIRLHADKTTLLDGAIKTGDNVEVQATEPPRPYKSGFVDHAVSIKHVSPAFYGGCALTGGASSADNEISEPAKVIIGNVVRIEGDNYVVKDKDDGKEIGLCVDKTTKRNVGGVTVGDRVMAKLGDQNHAEVVITVPENQFR